MFLASLPAVLMVFFERPVYMVREDDLVAMVTVLASEPHALPFTITVVATDGSAIGTTHKPSSVVFKYNQSISQSVQMFLQYWRSSLHILYKLNDS